jgi:hypothetical protein
MSDRTSLSYGMMKTLRCCKLLTRESASCDADGFVGTRGSTLPTIRELGLRRLGVHRTLEQLAVAAGDRVPRA